MPASLACSAASAVTRCALGRSVSLEFFGTRAWKRRRKARIFLFQLFSLFFQIINLLLIERLKLRQAGQFVVGCFVDERLVDLLLDKLLFCFLHERVEALLGPLITETAIVLPPIPFTGERLRLVPIRSHKGRRPGRNSVGLRGRRSIDRSCDRTCLVRWISSRIDGWLVFCA